MQAGLNRLQEQFGRQHDQLQVQLARGATHGRVTIYLPNVGLSAITEARHCPSSLGLFSCDRNEEATVVARSPFAYPVQRSHRYLLVEPMGCECIVQLISSLFRRLLFCPVVECRYVLGVRWNVAGYYTRFWTSPMRPLRPYEFQAKGFIRAQTVRSHAGTERH